MNKTDVFFSCGGINERYQLNKYTEHLIINLSKSYVRQAKGAKAQWPNLD